MLARCRIALLTLPLWPSLALAQSVVLRVAYEDKDTPDHPGAGPTISANPGIVVEMVALLEKRLPDLRVSFFRKPWSRCLAELAAGSVDEVDQQENAFRMVLAGRLDGFVQLGMEGDSSLKSHPEFQRVVRVAPPVATKDYYLQISHQFQAEHPELTLEIWKALAAIRQAESERLTLKYLKAYAE